MKKYDEALQALREEVEANPTDTRSWLKIGDLEVRRGNRAAAVSAYERVAELYIAEDAKLKAIAVLRQVLKLDRSRESARAKLELLMSSVVGRGSHLN